MTKTTIEANGVRYYIINKKIVDEHYLVPSKDELIAIYNDIINYKDELTYDQLFDFAACARDNGCYHSALEIVQELQRTAIKTNDFFQIRKLAPITTSLLRRLNNADKAIEYFENLQTEYYSSILSSALLTSVAAAYCDLHNYTVGKKYADRAYAMDGWSIELANVYERIKNEA